ncbi:cell wall metabolism sensor histidine kinase WalK [Oscillospiraceae bacterium HV4-5-C5C]|nr:cell wall metabolism sensor histidine kinase WalK [Oscillospiraceae bacterium HV4-5-C5C]
MKKELIRGYLLTLSAGLLAALLLAAFLSGQIYTNALKDRMKATLVLLASAAPTDANDLADFVSTLSDQLAAANEPLRIAVLDQDGTVLADSSSSGAQSGEERGDRNEIQEARQGGFGFDSRRSQTNHTRYMYAAYLSGDYIIRIALPQQSYRIYFQLLPLFFIACFAVGALAAWVLARRTAKKTVEPVEELTATATAIATGDTKRRVPPFEHELGELSTAFNLMTDQLQQKQRETEDKNAQLTGILEGMQDGVAAVDDHSQVLLLTDRAKELLGPVNPRLKRLDTYGANYTKVARLARQAMESGQASQETLHLSYPQPRILDIYTGPIRQQEEPGAILVIKDVTRLKQLENLRQEFMANVTHELKTPLTSIRGYLELLKSSQRDEETRQQFYEIIDIEADRLMHLITDMLELSEIENRPALDRQEAAEGCDLAEVSREVLAQLQPIADEHQVTLHLELPEPSLRAPAAHRRMRQLLTNLMSNAILYNKPGGAVWVTAGRARDHFFLRVRDNGIGIPAEHQARIFERFYRVYKERSRALGGTGLGLSIVKHIAQLYGGSVQLESRPDEGSVFTVYLPLPLPQAQAPVQPPA